MIPFSSHVERDMHSGPPLLLTDLDNTVYDWVDFFAPSVRGMIHVLAREIPCEEALLFDEFKLVYSRVGSLEYAFSVQELPIIRSRPKEEIERLVTLAKKVFHRVRQATLKPYDGVRETLGWARREGVVVVGVTNAPIDHVERRLKGLFLDDLFDGLCGGESHEIPTGFAWTEAIRDNAASGKYRSRIQHLWPFPKDRLKPSMEPYQTVMRHFRASSENTYVVGDSIQKDLVPAMQLGLHAIWAEYGTMVDPKNMETLFRITHWSPEKIQAVYGTTTAQPSARIQNFSELQTIVTAAQARLF